MKILHLADLHIGKKINDFCLLNEQKFVLSQAIELIKNQDIRAVLISGDVFDKPIPPISALELFNEFLNELNFLSVKTLIISGNHDNMDRLSYLSSLLEKSNIFISKSFDGYIQKVNLDDNICVYLMPYLYPALVKKHFPDKEINSYNSAINAVVDSIELDESKVNIILSHQFVVGSDKVILSDSEQKSVGGIDEANYSVYEKFDYTALGHLHCPQKCGSEKVCYAGSILKYSLSEINQNKKFCVLDVKGKNDIKYLSFPIKTLHQMKQYRGLLEQFLDKSFYEKIDVEDYIHFILEDEYVLDAKKKLSMIYPNILFLEFDNSYTRNLSNGFSSDISKDKTMYEHFCDFYKIQMNQEMDDEKDLIVKDLINKQGGL